MRFSGALLIVLGIVIGLFGFLIAISAAGLLVGALPIWMGVALLQAATRIDDAFYSEDPQTYIDGVAKLRTYLVLQSAALMIILAAMLLYHFGDHLFWGLH